MKPAPDSCLPSLDLNGILAALGIAAKPSAATTAYTVVPGNDGPRWLIPNRSELAPAILREWRPYRPASRLFWSGVRLAARTGTLRLVPRTTQIDVPVDAVSRFLGYRDLAADAMPPVIMVGNRSVTRKLLVFLVSRGDNLRAVVKVPLTSLARDSIRNEAGTLEGLSGRYGAPRLIHYSEDTGAAIQEYLAGRLGSRRCKPSYLRILLDLARGGETVSLRARSGALQDRLNRVAAHGRQSPLIGSALAWLDNGKMVPAALVHGDFAPWNIREMDNGTLSLIDWESAEPQGLPLHDLCHFFYMLTRVFSPRASFYARLLGEGAWRGYCRELDLPHSLVPHLAAGFLLETLARSWESGHPQSAAFCLRQLDMFLKHAGKPAS
ncbi:MAG: phosphotransferase [Terracidiphilus sp.]